MSLFIVHYHEPKQKKDFFIPWDNGKKQPFNEEARFFELEDLQTWFRKHRPGDLGKLKQWVAICIQGDRGVNNLSPVSTRERVFAKVRLPDGGRLTPEVAFEMYGPKPAAKAAPKVEAKPEKKAPEKVAADTKGSVEETPEAPKASAADAETTEKKSGSKSQKPA